MAYLERIDLKKVFITLVAIMVVLPFLAMAGDKHKIYVDHNASGKQDGSSKHPYKDLSKAVSKSNGHTRIYLKDGVYNENITLPDGAELYGSDEDGSVIIDAKDEDKPVIMLKGGARIVRITVRDGKNGIRTNDDGKVNIIKCNIRSNHQEGIYIKGNNTKEGNQVNITNSNIENNGSNGIFSEKRKITIQDSRIKNNGSDGISLSSGVDAWLDSNSIRENSGSGIKARLDNAFIFTKNNTINDNDRAGVEVISYGKSGRIDLSKSAIRHNGYYGVLRISRDTAETVWKGLTIQSTASLWDNGSQNVSSILNFQ
ncbi:MAG: right-handed parallel beta-helix repeat-containing protein [Candidatus Moranbacteria bacterium]|nr:right-handed parallel beta-helix repeat-containing protein [Candidatus Moranbacteria bacterium]